MRSLRPLLPLHRIPLTRSFTTTPSCALARTQLIGRLASAPELVATPSGREVIRYAVGVEAGPKSAREVSWFRVASFDEGARREFVMGLQKGTLVYVDAESRMRSYEDGEGRRRTQLDLVQRKSLSFSFCLRPGGARWAVRGLGLGGPGGRERGMRGMRLTCASREN